MRDPDAPQALAGAADIEFGGEQVTLLPERAVWWGRTRTLFAADLHIGKAAAFREWGAPVPEAVTLGDLARLAALIDDLRPQRLVILGDLLHALAGAEEALRALTRWRRDLPPLPIILIRGNHDRHTGDALAGPGFTLAAPPLDLDGLQLLHDPGEHDGRTPALAGHLHPGVVLRPDDVKGAALRAPCFWIRGEPGCELMVLPAFGTFTGLLPIRPREGDRVFAVGSDAVLEMSAGAPAT